jgi:hypothetical protein
VHDVILDKIRAEIAFGLGEVTVGPMKIVSAEINAQSQEICQTQDPTGPEFVPIDAESLVDHAKDRGVEQFETVEQTAKNALVSLVTYVAHGFRWGFGVGWFWRWMEGANEVRGYFLKKMRLKKSADSMASLAPRCTIVGFPLRGPQPKTRTFHEMPLGLAGVTVAETPEIVLSCSW